MGYRERADGVTRLKAGLVAFGAGGALIVVLGPAFHLGSIPPVPSDPAWWWWLLEALAVVAVVLLIAGGIDVALGATGHPLHLVRERTRGYGIKVELQRPPPSGKPSASSEPPSGSTVPMAEARPAPAAAPVAPSASSAGVADDGLGQPSVKVPTAFGLDQPPVTWTAPYWNGKQVLRCPWDEYRTIDAGKFGAHGETHTEPPNETAAQEVYPEPRPWATTQFHYIGDGSAFVSGVSTDPTRTQYAAESRVAELLAHGIFALGPAPTPGLVHAEIGHHLGDHELSEGLVRPATAYPVAADVPLRGSVQQIAAEMQRDLDAEGDQPTAPPKLTYSPQDLAAAIGPDDIVRALNGLYERGERLTAKFDDLLWPVGEGAWREATMSVGDWFDDVARVFNAQRPQLVIPLRAVRARRPEPPLVELPAAGSAAPINAAALCRDQIRDVGLLIRKAIG